MSALSDRKVSYKQPPRSILDRTLSQETRRKQALDDQKRRRAKRIDSERHIDLFAGLRLGDSDDDDGGNADAEIVRSGVAQLAAMLHEGPSGPPPTETKDLELPTAFQPKRKGRRKKAPPASKKPKPNKWAEKIMYAELLEMPETDPWTATPAFDPDADAPLDGLPPDLQTNWVAVAPVPTGKRCLAISHQGSGSIGVVPNTVLRSRLLGKPLMPRFPSPLPSDTILDCILDQNWQDNGILHVLDVLKWKGQDVADCESSFRFWWRDTRLCELPPPRPPTSSAPASLRPNLASAPIAPPTPTSYKFPYPTTFHPIAYHTDTTLPHLLARIIPLARAAYSVPVSVPVLPEDGEAAMDVEQLPLAQTVQPAQVELQSDGLLLYVAQAIYEPGTSPLSSWVPRIALAPPGAPAKATSSLSPLDTFESLVKRRLAREHSAGHVTDEAMQS
ncbi:hypothetical protein FA95DRAFT_1527857 [Auriscalpium vulgare]|uniref:Uncharacterized protein n=1 Tax=Auriscalpium vulgare TaxID=40419 RepID=A0ACB8R858_9AGAM|nr:hypothetical protein FA95DRAFT_1527857 [Auriscalpium vulgare]